MYYAVRSELLSMTVTQFTRRIVGQPHITVASGCRELWIKREASEKAPAQRRAPPPQPPQLDEPLPKTPAGIDQFNEAMSQIFNGVSLVACKHCGRTFRLGQLKQRLRYGVMLVSSKPLQSSPC